MVKKLVVGGDFGGTNARLQTLSSNGEFSHSITYPRSDYAGPVEILKEYEDAVGGKITVASLAVAGIVVPGTDKIFMGNGWTFSMAELRQEFGDIRVMNDFTPVAYSVIEAAENPENANVVQMGGGKAHLGNIALVGPGTGLGSAQIVRIDDKYHVVESETCAATIAQFDINKPRDNQVKRQIAQINPDLRRTMILELVAEAKEDESFGHVSAERLVSGPGLQHLYDAVCTLNEDWRNKGASTPAQISKAALDHNPDPSAREALDLMMHFMGTVMGNMVTGMKATGGAYIASHIVNKIMDADPDYIAQSPLRAAFEAKGRLTSYMKDIPIFVLRDKEPAFTGLKFDLKQHLGL